MSVVMAYPMVGMGWEMQKLVSRSNAYGVLYLWFDPNKLDKDIRRNYGFTLVLFRAMILPFCLIVII